MSGFPLTANPLPDVMDEKLFLKPSISSSPFDYDFFDGPTCGKASKVKRKTEQLH